MLLKGMKGTEVKESAGTAHRSGLHLEGMARTGIR